MRGSVIRHFFQNTFLANDPGFERLGAAARSVAVTVGAAITLFGFHLHLDMPFNAFMLGVMLALQINMFIRDETRHERLGTAMYGFAAAVLAVILVSAFDAVTLLKQWMFLPVVFFVFYLQRYGLRAKTVSMMFGWIYLFGAYYQANFSQLGWYLLAFFVAFGAFFLIRFFVWRDDRRRGWKFYYKALFVNIARLLSETCKGRPGKRRELQLCSIALEDRLYRFGHHEAISDVQDLRLETERLATKLTDSGGEHPACGRMESVTEKLRKYPFHGFGLTAGTAPELERLEKALMAVTASIPQKARRRMRHETPKISERNVKMLEKDRIDPHLRKAIQATLAVGITLSITLSISTTHWLWGILASLFVFMGTESTGHVFDKGWKRVSGTVFGIIAGLLLARLLTGFPLLEFSVILVGVFFMVYYHTVNFTMSTFAATTSIGLVYTVSDILHMELMELRLIETLVGATAGFFTARMVLGTQTQTLVRAGSADLLRAIRKAINREYDDDVLAVFEVDRQLRSLENQVNPLISSVNFIHRKRVSRRMLLFDLAVHFTKRTLRVSRTESEVSKQLYELINRHLEVLLEMFEDRNDSPYVSGPPDFPIDSAEERILSYLEKSLRDIIDEFRR